MYKKNDENEIFKCGKTNHSSLPLNLICIEENCENNRLVCPYCMIEYHGSHANFKMSTEQFRSSFSNKYGGFIKHLNDLNSSIKKMDDIKIIQSYINIFEESLEKLKVDFNQKIENFKKNIKYYMDFSQMETLSKMYEEFQQQNKNKLIYEFCDLKKPFSLKEETTNEIVNIYLNDENLNLMNSMITKMETYHNIIFTVQNNLKKIPSFFNELNEEMKYGIESKIKEYGQKITQYFKDLTRKIDPPDNLTPNFRISEIQRLNPHLKIDLRYLKKDKEGNLCISCSHYISNYITIFKCCEKQHPCYLCHEQTEKHKTTNFKGVLCINCGNLGKNFNKCSNCSLKYFMIY